MNTKFSPQEMRAFIKGAKDTKNNSYANIDNNIAFLELRVKDRLIKLDNNPELTLKEKKEQEESLRNQIKQITTLKEARRIGMEMATIKPWKDPVELLADYTGRDIEYIKQLGINPQQRISGYKHTEGRYHSKSKDWKKLMGILGILGFLGLSALAGMVEKWELNKEQNKYQQFRQEQHITTQTTSNYSNAQTNSNEEIVYHVPDFEKD